MFAPIETVKQKQTLSSKCPDKSCYMNVQLDNLNSTSDKLYMPPSLSVVNVKISFFKIMGKS